VSVVINSSQSFGVRPFVNCAIKRFTIQLAICCAVLLSTFARGQEFLLEPAIEAEQRELETDRDAFTPALTTVGFRTLVVESAYTFIETPTQPKRTVSPNC
jgi:hypothetical protein